MTEMNLEEYKSKIVTNVYRISTESNVKFHKHPKHDEIFYCVKGSGFGVLENEVTELSVGERIHRPGKVECTRLKPTTIYMLLLFYYRC